MNILIIDDDPEDTEIFCEALNEIAPNAICNVSNSCKEVRSLLLELPSQDFIFLDGHMYPVSGKQCMMDVLKTIDVDRTKIIIHTGSLSPIETTEFNDLGVKEIIRKANGFEELKANLTRILC